MHPAKKGPAFTHRLILIDRHARNTGLDGALHVLMIKHPATTLDITDVSKTTELYLLSNFGKISQSEILIFNKAILASTCEIDKINNRMCFDFLHGSVYLEMQKLLDQEMPIEVSAAYMLWHIIQKVQGVNSTAGC